MNLKELKMKKITIIILLIAAFSQIWLACQKEEEDMTPPADVTNFEAIAGEGQVELSWTKPNDADLNEFVITYGPKGMVVILDNSKTSFIATKLTGYVEYSFTVKSKDVSGNLSGGVIKKAIPTPIDIDPPGEVTNLLAKAGDGEVELSWSNPSDSDFNEIEITYEPGGGKQMVSSNEESVTITGLTNDTEYTFTLKTIDQKGRFQRR